MDRSISLKKLERAQQIFANLGTEHLTSWTKKELKKFKSDPIVIPTGDYGFLVGIFVITGKDKDCWNVTTDNGNFIHNFISKQNAILFCLYETTKKYWLAKEILDIDDKIGRLDNDIKHYQHIANVCRDKVKNSNAINRYIDAKVQKKTYMNILKKTLNSAKYFNFGN